MAEEEGSDMSFLEHLEELRGKLLRAVVAILIGATIIWIFGDWVFDKIILAPHRLDFISFRGWCWLSHNLGLGDKLCVTEIPYTLQSLKMLSQFTAYIMVGAIGGFILAFPVVFNQFWGFIKPGLKKNEVTAVRGVNFFAALLFLSGISFGYFLVAPLSLQFLGSFRVGSFEQIKPNIELMSYMKTVMSDSLAAGLVFELPMIVHFLSRIGIVTPELLKKYRRHALVGVLVLSAIITPPDLFSQILVAIPIMILYQVSIVVARRNIRKYHSE